LYIAVPGRNSRSRSRHDHAPVRGATRRQGRTHGDQRTSWRGLRIAERRKTSTLRLSPLVQVTGFLLPTMRAAIDTYTTDKKRPPESLQTLVEDHYILEIPVDPITSRRDWVLSVTTVSECVSASMTCIHRLHNSVPKVRRTALGKEFQDRPATRQGSSHELACSKLERVLLAVLWERIAAILP